MRKIIKGKYEDEHFQGEMFECGSCYIKVKDLDDNITEEMVELFISSFYKD